MSFRRSSRVLAVVVSLVAAGSVSAQEAEAPQDLDAIREMVLYARYDEAAHQYLEQPGLSARERNAGLEVLATAQLANRDRGANETLSLLYSRDPQHRLSDSGASPTVVAAFQRAAERAPEPVQPELIHDPPRLETRHAPVVEVRLGESADAVDEVRISYRQQGEAGFTSTVMAFEDGAARARLPLAEGSDAYTLEYHLEARAPSGAVLARLGSPDEPLALNVPEATAVASGGVPILPAGGSEGPRDDEGGGVLAQWWFWTAVVVLVGGGVAAGILLTSGDEEPPQGSLGTFRLGE